MTTFDPKNPGERVQGGSRLGTWLTQHLGFGSIRGRYLLVAGFFAVFVLVAGWAAQKIVNQTARQSSVNVSERESISHRLNGVSDDIWLTETALQGFLLSPDNLQRTTTLATIDHIIADIKNLSDTDWTRRSASRRDTLQRFSAYIQELRRESDRLMEIRADAEKLFPAARLMLDKMLPNNIHFRTLATLAMDEARERRGAPSQEEIHGLFAETRYAWAIMRRSRSRKPWPLPICCWPKFSSANSSRSVAAPRSTTLAPACRHSPTCVNYRSIT